MAQSFPIAPSTDVTNGNLVWHHSRANHWDCEQSLCKKNTTNKTANVILLTSQR